MSIALALVCTFALPTASASKDLTYTTIDFPSAILTVATDINPNGQIVGVYRSADGKFHGFLLSKGSFTTINVPGAIRTQTLGINARGDIVGIYVSAEGKTHGFLLSKKQ